MWSAWQRVHWRITRRWNRLRLPGNLMAIGDGAIPRGVVVEGYNASYAQDWARSSRYAFCSLSQWDFMDGVVDYADIRVDAFVRVSQSEVRLRALEASRLRVGSLFFLLDPDNPYQVSYYKLALPTLIARCSIALSKS